jgi:NADH-quinone oxidoreductase subunit A
MPLILIPILLFVGLATGLSVTLLLVGGKLGPKRNSPIKEMPYESGMDPIHDARRRFDVRFHLVAIAFLVFDVELLFLYPWAVARRDPAGFAQVVQRYPQFSPGLVFVEVLVFVGLLAVGFVYAWRKGVFQWR